METIRARIQLSQIIAPDNAHRTTIDEAALYELADSIREHGLLQPILVRARGEGVYEIIAGHRRYLAHHVLHAATIDCLVCDANDAETEALRGTENLQRTDLSPLEEARALRAIANAHGDTPRELARRIGRTPWWVERRLQLLDLPDDLHDKVHTGELPASSALLLGEIDDEQHRQYLTHYALEGGATTTVIRTWVEQYHLDREIRPNSAPTRPALPPPGEPVIVQMPCAVCGTAHDHRKLLIHRICADCTAELHRVTGA